MVTAEVAQKSNQPALSCLSELYTQSFTNLQELAIQEPGEELLQHPPSPRSKPFQPIWTLEFLGGQRFGLEADSEILYESFFPAH